MNAPRNSLLARVALNSMDLAVRHWPENSRQWGQAMLAEMGEIREPGAVVNWAAGGMLLFARAVVGQFLEWMKLPVGRGVSGAGLTGNVPQFPKHSRWVTALILLAAVGLLFLPIGREAMGTVKESWSGFVPSQGDRRGLEKIAAKAEQEKDARGLAFVALAYPDDDRAMQFADRAVALDPSLTWIYVGRRYSQPALLENTGRLERLQSYDPDNAVVYLVGASLDDMAMAERAFQQNRAAFPKNLANVLAGDPNWHKEMDRAFHSPRYDSYFPRYRELIREGWQNNPQIPAGLVAMGAWSHSFPKIGYMREYADLRISEALNVAAAGRQREAESMLAEITGMGKKMMSPSATDSENLLGTDLTQRGLMGFKKLYQASGQANEKKEIERQLDSIKTSEDARVHSYVGNRIQVMDDIKWKAVGVQYSAILALFLAIAVICSVLLLEVGAALRWKAMGIARRIAGRIAYYGPVLFLCAIVVFLASFRPMAEIFARYRSTEHSNTEAMGFFWQLYALKTSNPLQYFDSPYHQWLIGTLALAAIAMIVLVRGLVRRKAVSTVAR